MKISINIVLILVIILNILKFKNTFKFRINYIQNLITNNKTNCIEIINFFLKRSIRFNYNLNVLITLNPNSLKDAEKLDAYYNLNKKLKGKLHCIPIAVKDNIDIKGLPTTGGIRALKNLYPSKNAPVIDKLLNKGAIIISKTNLGELAYGNEESELGGECHNPYDLKRSCGTSSLGSGAAIASGLAIISLGTDTDGSVLQPGSFNSLFALRPPFGKIPTDGIIPVFKKQDTVGILTKHIEDLVITYSILSNNDNKKNSKNFKIGIWNDLLDNLTLKSFHNKSIIYNYTIDKQVKLKINEALLKLKNLNITLKEFNFKSKSNLKRFLVFHKILIDESEKCLNACKKFEMNRYFANLNSNNYIKNFQDLIKSPLLSQNWKKDLKKSDFNDFINICDKNCRLYDLLKQNFKNYFNYLFKIYEVDSIMIPTCPLLPYLINDKYEIPNYLSFAAYTDNPALNIPIGFSSSPPAGLPIGMLLITVPKKIYNLFEIGKLFENF